MTVALIAVVIVVVNNLLRIVHNIAIAVIALLATTKLLLIGIIYSLKAISSMVDTIVIVLSAGVLSVVRPAANYLGSSFC